MKLYFVKDPAQPELIIELIRLRRFFEPGSVICLFEINEGFEAIFAEKSISLRLVLVFDISSIFLLVSADPPFGL